MLSCSVDECTNRQAATRFRRGVTARHGTSRRVPMRSGRQASERKGTERIATKLAETNLLKGRSDLAFGPRALREKGPKSNEAFTLGTWVSTEPMCLPMWQPVRSGV
jgi:hypothetical protein